MPIVTIPKAIDAGLLNLKANFWPYMLIIVILGILESIGKGSGIREGMSSGWFMMGPMSGGILASFIAILVKPVFDYGAKMVFLQGHRDMDVDVDVKDIIRGFDSRALYIDIILTNIIVLLCIILGMICLVLPGIFVACRTVLAPYLVMDKGLPPREAFKASWALTRDYWPIALGLGIISFLMIMGGLLLLVVGMIPAFAWVKAMFASYYQQVLDAHTEEDLQALHIL